RHTSDINARTSPASLFFIFFFSRRLGHRTLHSFPTRRSSDLGDRLLRAGQAVPQLALGLHRGRRFLDTVPHLSHAPAAGEAGRRDRKSTRLNSSHVSISYAVFCLKKKKQGVERRAAKALRIAF